MTTSEIEAWLKERYPNKDWVISEKLGIGLQMYDGVMFFTPLAGNLLENAEYVIRMTEGKHIT